MKVLLWKIGALGDVVMTTPLVRQLRRNLPDAQIDYLVGHSFRGVLDGNPHLDTLRTFDEKVLLHRRAGSVGTLLSQLRGYDVVYVLDKHAVFGWLAWLSRTPCRIGFRRRSIEGWAHTVQVPYGALRHEIDCYLDLAEAAGLSIDRADRRLELPPVQAVRVNLQQPYVVASNAGGRNPGERSAVRQLPASLFTEVVARLARTEHVVFLGSQEERPTYEELARRHDALNLCGTLPLPAAWSVLARAKAVLTTDNGLMHMAGAGDAPVIALFGPTHPLRKAPPGSRWLWSDQDRYDPEYEVFGRQPRGSWFDRLHADEVLEALASAEPDSR